METKEQLIDDVRQLCAQYLKEVPSRRRVWPRSIRGRVLALLSQGLACDEISQASGIPAATIYSWKSAAPPRDTFLPVRVIAKPVVPKNAVPNPAGEPRRDRGRPRSTPTIIVVMPNGLRFEGLTVASALELARGLA